MLKKSSLGYAGWLLTTVSGIFLVSELISEKTLSIFPNLTFVVFGLVLVWISRRK